MKHLIIISYNIFTEFIRKILLLSKNSTKILYLPGFNKYRKFHSKVRTYARFIELKNKVPAYRQFLKSKSFEGPSFNGLTPNTHEIPEIDKENYVKEYSLEQRCLHGKIPLKDVIIDESSGSSGKATNWIRGIKERQQNAKMIEFGLENLIGKKPIFILNAFALGPWATGVNVAMSCTRFSKMKSTGPDVEKIRNTLMEFGTSHKYVIMGYPPFLKILVDNCSLDWSSYDITFILGGESFPESMREYIISKGIKKVYSSLGASDLELNISAENDFTINLRKLLNTNSKLKKRVLKYNNALPMIFQYNPADFLFESSTTGELIVSICRPNYLSPKVRYNLHDRGHSLDLKELYSIMKELNIDTTSLGKPKTDLPLLFHYGRADMTVSFFGSNISPTDVQEVIFSTPEIRKITNNFSINTAQNENSDKKLVINIELNDQITLEEIDQLHVKNLFYDRLARVNQDFREAQRMIQKPGLTALAFYELKTSSFKENDLRIKSKYIICSQAS